MNFSFTVTSQSNIHSNSSKGLIPVLFSICIEKIWIKYSLPSITAHISLQLLANKQQKYCRNIYSITLPNINWTTRFLKNHFACPGIPTKAYLRGPQRISEWFSATKQTCHFCLPHANSVLNSNSGICWEIWYLWNYC